MNTGISLLMTSFNNSDYIAEAIESVISQKYPMWELIIVDDVSTDNSLEIINKYLTDKRIKLYKHKKNIGYAGSLKTAIEKSSYKIIGIIDSDDALHKNAVNIMLKEHKKYPEFGLIYSTMWNCDKNLNKVSVSKWVGIIEKGKTNLHRPRISHFKTFKKVSYNKTLGFDQKQMKAVDKDIVYKLEEVTKLKYIDDPLYYYREHSGGISQGDKSKKAKIYNIIAKYKAYKRRKGTNIPNLSADELIEMLSQAIELSKK